MIGRKGAEGAASGAAALIAIIFGLIVLYILLVPPETRYEILGENETGTGETNEEGIDIERILVAEHPGSLTEVDDLKVKNSLPSIYLTSIYESKEVDFKNTIYVANGLFSEKADYFDFVLDDPDNTKNALLSFNVNKYEGRLTIKLNGEVIYNNEIDQPSIAPIKLPDKYLKEENVLEFRVSGKIIGSNEYILESVKVTADVKDISAQQATTSFLLSTEELLNLDRMSLVYYPDCSPGEVNPLDIYLNNRLLVSGIPDCGSLHKKEFLADRLVTGENQLLFKSTRGAYLIRDLSVTAYLEEPSFPTYYFEIDDEKLEEIEDEGLNMTFKFLGTNFKNVEVSVNGELYYIDTKEREYDVDISESVREGTNGIKITPKSTGIDILDFKVIINE